MITASKLAGFFVASQLERIGWCYANPDASIHGSHDGRRIDRLAQQVQNRSLCPEFMSCLPKMIPRLQARFLNPAGDNEGRAAPASTSAGRRNGIIHTASFVDKVPTHAVLWQR